MSNHLRLKSKRILITAVLGLGLAGSATIALARSGDTSSADAAVTGSNSAANANDAAKTGAPAAAVDPSSPVALELKELKEAVDLQAKQFADDSEGLEGKLGIPPDPDPSAAPPGADAVVSTPSSAQAVQAQVPQDWSTRVGNIEDRLKDFGPFAFSGDLRLRDEPFFGGPSNESLDQNRERFRLRFNVNAKLNEDFAGGFSLASGDLNDPTSTNQTVGDFYTRKAIWIDKAFADYTPHQFSSLTLIGGKFAYPWYNTELTWDKDLNPEGVAETLAFNLNSTPLLKKIAFVGFELPFTQVAGVSLTDQSLKSSVVYGGQIQTQWQLASWLKFGAYTGFYNYHNADPIALALAKASAKNPQTPLTGLLPLGTGNTVQNSIITTTATNEVTVGGTSYPTGVTTVTNAQFASKFGLFDSIARLDVKK